MCRPNRRGSRAGFPPQMESYLILILSMVGGNIHSMRYPCFFLNKPFDTFGVVKGNRDHGSSNSVYWIEHWAATTNVSQNQPRITFRSVTAETSRRGWVNLGGEVFCGWPGGDTQGDHCTIHSLEGTRESQQPSGSTHIGDLG